MQRYRVVAFETLFTIWADQVVPRGGGIAFFPLDVVDWSSAVIEIARAHFHHHTVRSAEVGVATLDPAMLEKFCRRFDGAFWQGGDAA